MTIKKYYSRKTSYGVSGTAHAILMEEESGNAKLLCRMAGTYKAGTLIDSKITSEDDPRICPECMDALANEVAARLKGEKTFELR